MIDPAAVFAAAPAVIAVSVMTAALSGLTEVKNIHAYECLGAGK